MNFKGAILIFVLGLALILSGTGEAAAKSGLSISAKPKKVEVGQSVKIRCRLWTKAGDGRRKAAQGGVLALTVWPLDGRGEARTYQAKPDGRTDIFSVEWIPEMAGRFEITAVYKLSGGSVEAMTEIEVGPQEEEIVLTPTPTPGKNQNQAGPDQTVAKSRSVAVPAASGGRTRLQLKVGDGSNNTGLAVDLTVTTADGRPVGSGEVLVVVTAGRLKSTGAKEAILPVDQSGRAKIQWLVTPEEAKSGILDATFFSGSDELRPSWSSLKPPS